MSKQTETNQTEETNDYMESLAGEGFEGVRGNDYQIPYLIVLQSNSPQVIKGDPAFVPGAAAGNFMNSLTKEVYGESIELVPLKCDAVWLEYTPKVGDKKGDFKGKHAVNAVPVEGNVFDGMFRTDNGNEIKETLVMYCLIKGQETALPVAFSMTSSMIKHAKAWNSLIFTVRTPSGKQAPFYSSYWKVTLALDNNPKGRWYNIGLRSANVERISFVPKEVLMIAHDTRKMLDTQVIKVDFAQITDGTERVETPLDTKDY